jgi:hypothetical protein
MVGTSNVVKVMVYQSTSKRVCGRVKKRSLQYTNFDVVHGLFLQYVMVSELTLSLLPSPFRILANFLKGGWHDALYVRYDGSESVPNDGWRCFGGARDPPPRITLREK